MAKDSGLHISKELILKTNTADPTENGGLTFNGTNFRAKPSGAVFSIGSGGSGVSDLQGAYDGGQIIDIATADLLLQLSDATHDYNLKLENTSGGAIAAGLTIDAFSNNSSFADGLTFLTTGTSATITDAIDASDAGIVNALNIGGNSIAGTFFNVSDAGATVCVGLNYGAGSLTGTGNIAINTAMFTVNGTTGDTVIAGTLGVTGALTAGSMVLSAVQPASGNLTLNGATGATTVTIGNLSTGGILIQDNMTISQPALFSTATVLNFRDTGIALYSSVDGQVDFDADVEIEITTATVDLNASAAVTIDTAGFSIDGTSSSNVTVTGADLNLTTLTSGNVVINAIQALNFDAGTTFDMLSAGVFSIDGTGASNVTATSGNLTISTLTSGTLILDSVALIDMNAGANLDIDITGSFDMFSTTGFSIDGTGNCNICATSGNLLVQTLTSGELDLTGAGLVDLNAGANLDIDITGSFDVLASTTFSIDGTGASNVTATSGNLTVSTATSGSLILSSAADVDIDAGGTSAVTINTANHATDTTGNITITTGNVAGATGNSGDIILNCGTQVGGTTGIIQLQDTVLVTSTNKIGFYDADVFINSPADGKIEIEANAGGADDITLDGGTTIPTGHLLTLADASSIRMNSIKVTAYKQVSVPLTATANSVVVTGVLPVIEGCTVTHASVAFHTKPASAAGTVVLALTNADAGVADNLLSTPTVDLEGLTNDITTDLTLTATGADLILGDGDYVYATITSDNGDMTGATGGVLTLKYVIN